jgi:hypothetical protein
LADDVGLGKTLQVLILIAMWKFYFDLIKRGKSLPRLFGEQCFVPSMHFIC